MRGIVVSVAVHGFAAVSVPRSSAVRKSLRLSQVGHLGQTYKRGLLPVARIHIVEAVVGVGFVIVVARDARVLGVVCVLHVLEDHPRLRSVATLAATVDFARPEARYRRVVASREQRLQRRQRRRETGVRRRVGGLEDGRTARHRHRRFVRGVDVANGYGSVADHRRQVERRLRRVVGHAGTPTAAFCAGDWEGVTNGVELVGQREGGSRRGVDARVRQGLIGVAV